MNINGNDDITDTAESSRMSRMHPLSRSNQVFLRYVHPQ